MENTTNCLKILPTCYAYWAKEDLQFDNQILVDDVKQQSSDWFGHMVLVDSIQDVNAREKGYIYYRKDPKKDVEIEWRNLVREEQRRN